MIMEMEICVVIIILLYNLLRNYNSVILIFISTHYLFIVTKNSSRRLKKTCWLDEMCWWIIKHRRMKNREGILIDRVKHALLFTCFSHDDNISRKLQNN